MIKKTAICFLSLLFLLTGICFAEEDYPLIYDNHTNFLVRVKKDSIKPITLDNKEYLSYYLEGKKREFFSNPWGIPIPVGTTKVAEEWRIYDIENKTGYKMPKDVSKLTEQELANLIYGSKGSYDAKAEKNNFLDQRLMDYVNKNIYSVVSSILENNEINKETFETAKKNRILKEEINEIPSDNQTLRDLMEKSKEGKFPKIYNAGANFEWSNEKDKENFENLPFTDDVKELASHVYKMQWDAEERGRSVEYVMFVPRHIQYGVDGEIKDQIIMIQLGIGGKICPKNQCPVDKDGNPIIEIIGDSKFSVKAIFQDDVLETVDLHEEEWSYFEEPQKEEDLMKLQSVTVLGGGFVPTRYKLVPTSDPRILDMIVTEDSPLKQPNARLIKLEEVTLGSK